MPPSSQELTPPFADVKFILDDLQRRFDNEQYAQVSLHAEGRLCFTFEGKELVRWLHRTLPQNARVIRNIVGNVVGTQPGANAFFNPPTAISKNSPMGHKLAEATPGQAENGFCLLTRALYIHQTNDLQDIEITTSTDDYERIPSLLDYQRELARETAKLRELKNDRDLLEQADETPDRAALDAITQEIKTAEESIYRIQQRLETFVTRTTLRSRPLLDPTQTRAKQLNLLAGPVIIEGGPGTGKTTTLIHRVQYLLDTFHLQQTDLFKQKWKAEDDELLSATSSGKQPYRFYSPNETLQFYLKEALLQEKLQVTSDTITTWLKHRQQLLKSFGLIGAGGRFQVSADTVPLLTLSGTAVTQMLNEADERLVLRVWGLVEKAAANAKLGAFSWQNDPATLRLQQQLADLQSHTTVEALLEPLQQVREQGAALLADYRNTYNEVRDKAVNQLMAAVRSDTALFGQLLKLAEASPESAGSTDEQDEEEDDDETFEEKDDMPAALPASGRELLIAQRLLRKFIRAFALAQTLPDTRLTGHNVRLAALLEPRLARLDLHAIADKARFMQLFGPMLGGPEKLLLDAWPRRGFFAAFRREVLYTTHNSAAGNNALKWTPEKATKLHPDEADLLLAGLFRLARAFYTRLPQLFGGSANAYLRVYREAMRPVLAVDEASDYPPLQLYALTQLAHPRYNCITLCGDLMQRLEPVGLLSWEDYETMFPATKRASLKLSYRQCSTLLRLAAKLYEGQLGQKPTYQVSKRIKMPFRLRPTYCRLAEPEARFDWLVKLVIDLHGTLGSKHLPNIAVLVADKSAADSLTSLLNDDDRFNYNGAALQATSCLGQTIGEPGNVRIFPVTEIKGMEFDGIIFWDADKLAAGRHDLDRLMYVAVSRASFYVAVTFEQFFPKALSKVKGLFTTDTWAAQMLADVADDGTDVEEFVAD